MSEDRKEERQMKEVYKRVLLARLSLCKSLSHLKQLQAIVETLGHSQTQFYAFKLLRFAAVPLADLSYSRRTFDSLRSPNVYLFAAAIAAHAAEQRHRDAFDLYRLMLRRGVSRPNHFVYPHAMKSCAEVLHPRAFGSVHTQIVKTGFGRDSVVMTGLVALYAKSPAGVECARNVFDEMPQRNVVTWTAMVSGYVRIGDVGEAMTLFERIPDRDIAAWNAMIAGCSQSGLFTQAISLFTRLMNGSSVVKPDGVTVASVLSACAHGGLLRLGRLVHGYACRNGLVPGDSFVSNALVDMYGKCGDLRTGRRVFDAIPTKQSMTWNSMVNCYALHGQSENAIRVFEEMMVACKDATAATPDEITFIGLFNACTHERLVEQGITYFDLMTRGYKIKPQVEHYGCLIDLLGRAGRFDEAMEVAKEMEPGPDEIVWSSLLNGCRIHRCVDLAELVVKKLAEINSANGLYAITLANMYGDLGKWDEFRKIRKALRESYGYKSPGRSWIEIGEKVWEFYSADTSHPRVEEIYDTLENLIDFICFKPSLDELLIQH